MREASIAPPVRVAARPLAPERAMRLRILMDGCSSIPAACYVFRSHTRPASLLRRECLPFWCPRRRLISFRAPVTSAGVTKGQPRSYIASAGLLVHLAGLLSNEASTFAKPVIRPTGSRPSGRGRQPAKSRRLTKLDSEQRSRLITRYREGRSIPQLAQEFGAHGQTIREVLLDAGEDVKTSMSRSLTEAQIAQAVRLRPAAPPLPKRHVWSAGRRVRCGER